MSDIFERTLESLERALRVEHIATFELETCDASDSAKKVLSEVRLAEFDYLPVRADGRVVGVLERDKANLDTSAGVQARRLDESTLMAASEPLTDFIYALATNPYRLVVRRGAVAGIATRSDIQKLPVRLLIFTAVTHLESQMARAIERLYADETTWLHLLAEPRKAMVLGKKARYGNARMEIAMVEFTEFADKRDILLESGLAMQRGVGKERARKELERIRALRDQVAHAATLPDSPGELVKRVVDVYKSAQEWIKWFGSEGREWRAANR